MFQFKKSADGWSMSDRSGNIVKFLASFQLARSPDAMRAWRLVLGKWSWSWGKSEQRSEIVDWTRHTTELFAALDKVFPRHNEFPRHCILIESGRPALSVYLKELNKFQIVYLDDAKVDEFNPHDPDLLIEQLYKLKQQIFSSIKA